MPRTRATLRVLLLLLIGAACSACAGKLDDPDRFSAVLGAFDASSPKQDAATPVGGSGGSQSGSGSPSGGSGEPPPEDEVPACVTAIFEDTCGTTGCHSADSAQIDLVSAGLEQRLVDQTTDSALCAGSVFIATEGGESLLLGKLEEMPSCGLRMPLVGTVNSTQRKCLNDWVVALGGTLP